MFRMIFFALALVLPTLLNAQTDEPAPKLPSAGTMTVESLDAILGLLDPDVVSDGRRFQIMIDDIPVLVVTDTGADRMRAMVPIRSADGLDAEELLRLMQANFDSALDARYAVAQGRLWGVFIHPLGALEREELISGIAQTVNVAKTYGGLYSSGGVQFGLGDSGDLQRELIERLLKKGKEI